MPAASCTSREQFLPIFGTKLTIGAGDGLDAVRPRRGGRRFDAGAEELSELELADAAHHVQPIALQVVAVAYGHGDHRLDRLNVLRLHVLQALLRLQERELCQRLHERVALRAQAEQPCDNLFQLIDADRPAM